MNSFYWTWINLGIEISQLLPTDDLSLPEDVLSIKNCTDGNKNVRTFHWKERREDFCVSYWGSYTPAYENTVLCTGNGGISGWRTRPGEFSCSHVAELNTFFFFLQSLSQLLISCTCVVLSLMSVYPFLVHNLSLSFSLFKIKAPDIRSPTTWVISQPLTFPSLKQPPARALIDPADGLGANLLRDRQEEVTVFHCSIWCNYPQNKHILDSSWPSSEGRWAECLCMSMRGKVFINQAASWAQHIVSKVSEISKDYCSGLVLLL